MEINIQVTKDGLTIEVIPSFSTEPTTYTITVHDSTGERLVESIDESLNYSVSSSGVYKVVVTAVLGDDTFKNGVFVLLEDPLDLTNQFIITLVEQLMFSGLDIEYSEFSNLKLKWITILSANFLDSPIQASLLNEDQIPFLYKYLIAHLIVRDLILKIAQQYLTASASNFISSSSSSGQVSAGTVKKIVSGPIETEYFGDDDSSSVQQTLKTAFIPGGMFENLVSTGCMLASHLGVYLSHCKNPAEVIYVPKLLLINDNSR